MNDQDERQTVTENITLDQDFFNDNLSTVIEKLQALQKKHKNAKALDLEIFPVQCGVDDRLECQFIIERYETDEEKLARMFKEEQQMDRVEIIRKHGKSAWEHGKILQMERQLQALYEELQRLKKER